jgi:hypothetical protein
MIGMKWFNFVWTGLIVVGLLIAILTNMQLLGGMIALVGALVGLGLLLIWTTERNQRPVLAGNGYVESDRYAEFHAQVAAANQNQAVVVAEPAEELDAGEKSVADTVDTDLSDDEFDSLMQKAQERAAGGSDVAAVAVSSVVQLTPEQSAARSAAEAEPEVAPVESQADFVDDGYEQVSESKAGLESGIAFIKPAKKRKPARSRGRGVLQVIGTDFTNAREILRNVITDHGGEWNLGGRHETEMKMILVPKPSETDPDAIAVYADYDTPEGKVGPRSGKIGYLPIGHGIELEDKRRVTALVDEDHDKFKIKIDVAGL